MNLHTQIDIDECANDTMNNCEQRCINTQGSFLCACGTGYQLNNDGMTCSGIYRNNYYIRWLTSYNNMLRFLAHADEKYRSSLSM